MNNYKLEQKIISVRTVTIIVLLYVTGFCIKITATLQSSLIGVIAFDWLRYATSFFFSVLLATGLLLVSYHKHNRKWLPIMFGLMDIVTLIMVFSTGANTTEINFLGWTTDIYIPTFKEVFFSSLISLVGFHLISIFVELIYQIKSNVKQGISDLIAELSKLEQEQSEVKQMFSEVLTDLEKECEIKRNILVDFEKRTCKNEGCGAVFNSVNGLNAHKNGCKFK